MGSAEWTIYFINGRPPLGHAHVHVEAHTHRYTLTSHAFLNSPPRSDSSSRPQRTPSKMMNYVMLVSRQGASRVPAMPDSKLITYPSTAITSDISSQRVTPILSLNHHRKPNLQRTGKVRLAKWFQTLPNKQKAKIVKDVTQLVLARRTRMCNFLEYKGGSGSDAVYSCEIRVLISDTKVIYRRYASLFFICAISPGDNELITLETIHRYVEVLDRYFGNVSTSLVLCTAGRRTRRKHGRRARKEARRDVEGCGRAGGRSCDTGKRTWTSLAAGLIDADGENARGDRSGIKRL